MISYAKNMFGAEVVEATQEMVQRERQSAKLKARYQRIADGDSSQKRYCPILLPNGVSKTGKRLNEDMTPTGNLFLDYDKHETGWQEVWNLVKDHLEEWGILLVEKSARGGAHMVVRRQPGLDIEEDIVAWEHRLGLTLDHVHDLARCMYLVPDNYVLYENPLLYEKEDSGVIATLGVKEVKGVKDDSTSPSDHTSSRTATSSEQSEAITPSEALTPITPSRKATITSQYLVCHPLFARKDVALRDVAIEFLKMKKYAADPEVGEDGNRNNMYLDMVRACKSLGDNNPDILFENLPTLGHNEEQRRSAIKTILKVPSTSLPHDFFDHLRGKGFLVGGSTVNGLRSTADALPTDEQKLKTIQMIKSDVRPSVPSFIPFPFRPYMNSAPERMKEVVMFCLVPLFYTLRPRIRSIYDIDNASFGRHTVKKDYCLSQTIIVGESGSGKSVMLDLRDDLMEKLKNLDMKAWENAQQYQKAVSANKYNTRKQPNQDEYKVNLRLIPAKTSVPALLEMQKDSKGLSQLMVCEELDTLSGSASGKGSTSMNINPLLRVAFTGGAYAQKYKNNDTFQGEVNLYLNVLATGTFNQLDTMFPDVMNGLVNRYNLCLMPDDWSGKAPKFAPLPQEEIDLLDAFVEDSFLHTYKDEDGLEVVPWYDVDTSWATPLFHEWVEQKIVNAEPNQDHATKTFCKRVGQMMNRLFAFIKDSYPPTEDFEADKEKVLKFCFYYGECSLHNMLSLYGLEYNRKMWDILERRACGVQSKGDTLLDYLPDVFDRDDIIAVQAQMGRDTTNIKRVICDLKRAGKIAPFEHIQGAYIKCA